MGEQANYRVTYRVAAAGRMISGALAAASLASILTIYGAGWRDKVSGWSAAFFAVATPMLTAYLFADVLSQNERLPVSRWAPVLPVIGATAALVGLCLMLWSLSWWLGVTFAASLIVSGCSLLARSSRHGVEQHELSEATT